MRMHVPPPAKHSAEAVSTSNPRLSDDKCHCRCLPREINQVKLGPKDAFPVLVPSALLLHDYLEDAVTPTRCLIHVCFSNCPIRRNVKESKVQSKREAG